MSDERKGLPKEFNMVFAVDVYGAAYAVEMPEGWQDFMDGSSLDDNGFEGQAGLTQGLYRAHAKVWHMKDWETGIIDDFGADLSDIRPIWTANGGADHD